ncbi:HEPN domain-containing protein [Chromobacterium sp. CV08]|uniref:HEPN domain-containing protein n=1 Tax=Chromobacterium sp. CV08 TaxID=3133274 RepID=UPI003DA9BB00
MTPIEQFNLSTERINNNIGLYLHLSKSTTAIIDLSDLLRSTLVQIVSALDQYVHQISLTRIAEIAEGKRPITDALRKFPVGANSLLAISRGADVRDVLLEEVRTKHSFLSFQRPDKISDAIRLFSNVELWKEVANKLGQRADEVKRRLELIIERRNKIAHEADIRPGLPIELWPIDITEVQKVLEFVKMVAHAIDDVTY